MENQNCAKLLIKILQCSLIFVNFPTLSQQFDVFVSIQCLGNGLYVATRPTNKGFAGLVAESASVTTKNFFSLNANSDETISFNVKLGGDWVWMIMDEKIGGKLRTSDLGEGANAKFNLIPQTTGKFVIKASNGKFVSCKSENRWLIADMDSPQSSYEEFELDLVTKITDTVTARVPLKIH